MKTEIDTLIFEKEYLSKGFSLIAGIDEAGRGPLAGPVTCACCMPDLKNIISGIDDSKKVTPKKREELFEAIKSSTDSYSIIDIDEKVIDKINIPDCLVIIGLVTALIMAIFYNLNELAMSIASGLLGYIGGTVKSAVHQKGEEKR